MLNTTKLYDILAVTCFILKGEAYCSTHKISSPLNHYVSEKSKQANDSHKEKPQDCDSDANISQSNPLDGYYPQVYEFAPYPIQMIGENPLKQLSAYSNGAKTKRQKVINLYKHLSEDYIFQTDDILSFYLNRDILKDYI